VQFAAEALAVHLLHHEGTTGERQESALAHMQTHMDWSDSFARKVARREVTSGLATRSNGCLKLTPYGRQVARRAMER
jgi:hypothetical protein